MKMNDRTMSMSGQSRFLRSKISFDRVGQMNGAGKERNVSQKADG